MIILLLWLYWSYLILLLGGELNSELEHEVIGDTTTGPVKATWRARRRCR